MPVFSVILRVLWTLQTQLTAAEDDEQQVRGAFTELVLEQTPPLLPTHHRTKLSYDRPSLLRRLENVITFVSRKKKEQIVVDTASDLPHSHPRNYLFSYLAKTDVIEYFYTAVRSACQEETNLY